MSRESVKSKNAASSAYSSGGESSGHYVANSRRSLSMIVLRAILPQGPAHPSMIRATWRVPFTKSAMRTNSSGACGRLCMLPIPAVITGTLSGREKA